MPPLAPLSGTLFQMAATAPTALVTSALHDEIGVSHVPAFLQEQTGILASISRKDGTRPNIPEPPHFVFGTAQELLPMALDRGVTDPLALLCTGLLCENVFVQGGLGWPTPVRRIGGLISERRVQGSLPWAIAALPIGRDLYLNGESLEGLSRSSRFDQMVLLPGSKHAPLAVDRGNPCPAPSATTYLGGRLWSAEQGLLPKVALHEASHYAHFLVLDSWIGDNMARPAGLRDAAFQRHCRRIDDGTYRVDFRFATLYLELAACLATGAFFETVLQSGEANETPLRDMVLESLVRGARYMTDGRYQGYLEKAGIPPPNPGDARSLTGTMQRFSELIG